MEKPNIGSGLHPISGFTSQTRDTIFAVGLQGVDSGDFDKIVSIIDDTVSLKYPVPYLSQPSFEFSCMNNMCVVFVIQLADVVEKGFNKERVESVLHSVELNMRHQSSTFGLAVLFGLSPLWNHDVNVLDALRQADQIAKLKLKLKNSPSYLQVIAMFSTFTLCKPQKLYLSFYGFFT